MFHLTINSIQENFFLINIVLAFILIYFEHNEPSVTWAWLLVLFMLPIIGFFIYLIFGMDGKRSKIYIKKQKNDNEIWHHIFRLKYDGLNFMHIHENKELLKTFLNENKKKYQKFVSLNYKTNNSTLCTNNKIDLFFNGNQLFDDIISEIDKAESYIHLQSYIIRSDFLSRKIRNALVNASNRGVEVKVLTDKIGSILLSKYMVRHLLDSGIEVSFFPQFTKFSVNLRNHRKVLVIDGKIGYIGGFNIGKEYIGVSKKFGHWRDSHAKIKGDTAKMLEISFIKDWNSSPKHKPIEYLEKYFPVIQENKENDVSVQIVRSGPDTKTRNIELAFVKLINTAQRSIYIATPYFMPGQSLTTALKNAIYSGVSVTIMIPKNPDHPFVYGASISNLQQLLDIGAKCYAYDNGFIHSKLLVIDEELSSVGSANFDTRSFKLNFEVTAFIYDVFVAKKIIEQIKNDIKYSKKLSPEFYRDMSKIDKAIASIARLLMPLL